MSDGELSRLEVLRDLDQKRLPTEAAAQLLGLERRQVFRLLRACRTEGATGMIPTHQADQQREQQTPAQRSMLARFTGNTLPVTTHRRRSRRPPASASRATDTTRIEPSRAPPRTVFLLQNIRL
jgi:hypothetical protein